MSEPITREEIFLNSIANEQNSNLYPITREEQYLSYIAGETNSFPTKPITRKEMWLEKIALNGISGGSGIPDGYIKPEGTKEITENGEHDVTTYAKVNVSVSGGDGGGTAVPDVGTEGIYIDTIYFNIGKSIEETIQILKTLPYENMEEFLAYFVVYCDSFALSIIKETGSDVFSIIPVTAEGSQQPIFISVGIGNGIEGWLADSIKVDSTTAALPEEFAGGQNELLKDIISITPFSENKLDAVIMGVAQNVVLPEASKIKPYAFYENDVLVNIEMPKVEYIGKYAFYDCINLAITELPSGIKGIDYWAFSYCKGLTTITFKGMPQYIMSDAFNGCTNITTINVPWAEGEVENAPWGATNATINYNYTGE